MVIMHQRKAQVIPIRIIKALTTIIQLAQSKIDGRKQHVMHGGKKLTGLN
jgi:hypothetical protein